MRGRSRHRSRWWRLSYQLSECCSCWRRCIIIARNRDETIREDISGPEVEEVGEDGGAAAAVVVVVIGDEEEEEEEEDKTVAIVVAVET